MFLREEERTVPQNDRTFDVTVVRIGHVRVEAASIEDAMAKANELPTSAVTWFDNHDATDAREQE